MTTNPYHSSTWSYQFWQEGYEAETASQNPFEDGTFQSEVWLAGYMARYRIEVNEP